MLLILVAFSLVFFTGCSKASRKASTLAKANRLFQAGEYPSAEIEYLNVLRMDPKEGEAWSRLGLIYFAQGEVRKAAGALYKAKDLAPDALEARSKMALIFYSTRRTQDAQAEVAAILAKDPAHEETLLLVADAVSSTNDVQQARKWFAAARQGGRETPGILVAEATVSAKMGDLKTSEALLRRATTMDPKSSAAHTALGTLLLRNGDREEAEKSYKLAYDTSPPRSTRKLRIVDLKLGQGKVEEAKQLLDAVTKETPDFLPALLLRGKVAFAEGKNDECLKTVESVLARDPENPEGLVLRAQLRIKQGEFPKAIADLEGLVRAAQGLGSSAVHFQLGVAHLLNRDVSKSLASLNQAIKIDTNNVEATMLLAEINVRRGDAQGAVASLTDLLRRFPKLTQAQAALAAAYQAVGRPNDAIAAYTKLNEMVPKHPRGWFMLGLLYRDLKRYPDARKSFEKVLELAPDDPETSAQLVELDLLARDAAGAGRRITKMLEKTPTAPGPHILRAMLSMAQTNQAQAEASLTKAIELDPANQRASMMLASLYSGTKRLPEAIARLEAATAKGSNNVAMMMQLGMMYSAQTNHQKAAATYERILKIKPDHAAALNNLAYLYAEQLGDLNLAFDYAKRARAASSNDPFTADTLGWVVYKRGEYSWALDLIQESARRMPGDPEVQYHLGMAHYMMGEEAPARVALQRATSSAREFKGKDQAARFLEILNQTSGAADARQLDAWKKRVAEQPDDPIVLSRMAQHLQTAGDGASVADLYEKALRHNPKSIPVMLVLARDHAVRQRDAKRAIERVKAARLLAPDDAEVAFEGGRIALIAGDYTYANSLLGDAARKLSANGDVRFEFSQALFGVGRYRESLAEAQAALGATGFAMKDTATSFVFLTGLLLDPARAAQNAARVQEVLKTTPSSIPALMVAGGLYQRGGNPQAAQAAYGRILELKPGFYPALREMAVILSSASGMDAKAQEFATRAKEVFTEDGELDRVLGVVAYRKGDFAAAVAHLSSSARRVKPTADVLFHLGLAQVKNRDAKAGSETLQKALQADPNHKLAAEAKSSLASAK